MNAPVATFKKSERSATQNSPQEIRVAYPYFHEKRTKNAAGVPFMNQKTGLPSPRYSATFMFPKLSVDPSQCANYTFLWSLAVEAARKMWPTNVDQTGNWVWPQGAQFAVKDGDVPFVSKAKPGQPVPTADEIAKKNAWRRGYWIVEAENFLDPGPSIAKIVNGQVTPLPAKVINGVELYKGGDFGFVNLHAYAYERETFGVNFGFDGFCFTREGEKIGQSGPRSAAQMFGGLAGTVAPAAPAAPGAAPMSPMPTAQGYVAPGPTTGAPMPTTNAAPPAAPPPPPPPPPGPAMVMAGLPPIPGR